MILIKFFLNVLDLNPEHNEASLNAERICNELGIKFNGEGKYIENKTILVANSKINEQMIEVLKY